MSNSLTLKSDRSDFLYWATDCLDSTTGCPTRLEIMVFDTCGIAVASEHFHLLLALLLGTCPKHAAVNDTNSLPTLLYRLRYRSRPHLWLIAPGSSLTGLFTTSVVFKVLVLALESGEKAKYQPANLSYRRPEETSGVLNRGIFTGSISLCVKELAICCFQRISMSFRRS